MKPELQRRVQRYGWDRAEPYYEERWQKQLRPAQNLMLEKARIGPGERVLDVACGTGLTTFPAAEAVGPSGRVVGVDLSDRMVDAAGRRAAERGHTHVEVAQMDAEALHFSDGAFDVALCGLGLMYFPEPITAIREMRRVLRPDGRASVAVWGRRESCGWAEVFPIVDRRVKTEVCPLFFQLGNGEAMRVALEMGGFEDVETERISYTLDYEDESEALTAVFAGGPVALAYQKFDEPTRAGAHAEYLESIQPYKTDAGGYAIPGEFVIAAARVRNGA